MVEVDVFRCSEKLPWSSFETENNVFLTHTYLRGWLEHLGVGEPEVAVSRQDGKTLSVFPLFLCSEHVWGSKLSVWKSLGWNSAWYPYSFLPSDQQSIAPFLAYLASREKQWDGVLVSCPSSLSDEVCRLARQRQWSATVWSEKTLPYLVLEGSWENYWEGSEKWLRTNVGRFLKRAAKAGTLELRKVESPEECRRLVERFVALHDARWSARGQRSKYVTRDRHRQFLEDTALGSLQDGRLYFPYLTLDGEPIAMAVCFLDRGKLYYVWPTFDVDYSRLAPGKLLLYYIIRDAFSMGVREVDLGPGADAYKFYWASNKRQVSQLLLYRSNLRLWGRYHAMPRLRSRVRSGLQRVLGAKWVQRIDGVLDRVGG